MEQRDFKSFFKDVADGNESRRCHYTTRLDTYGCGCAHDCRYCLHPNTPILMYDGTCKPIEQIEVGDEIYGVVKEGPFYRYRKAMVLNKWEVHKPSYKITLSDGREVICSADHRWLTLNGWKGTINRVKNCEPISDKDSIIFEKNIESNEFGSVGIVSIQFCGNSSRLIDITTTTENFIANGLVSHNCYAKSLLSFRGLWKPNSPAVADISEIRKVIQRELKEGDIVRLGGMTDCFQPIEREQRVTYQTIQALNAAGVGYLIVTKSALIAEPEYLEILDKRLAHIQVSITTTDNGISKHYEPGASLPDARINAIETLAERGYDAAIRLSPYIPEFVNIDKINAIRCDKIIVEFLRVNTWIERWMKDINLSPYTLVRNGYRHLPLAAKKNLIARIHKKEISVCEDVYGHWVYWKENLNINPNDCCNLRK